MVNVHNNNGLKLMYFASIPTALSFYELFGHILLLAHTIKKFFDGKPFFSPASKQADRI